MVKVTKMLRTRTRLKTLLLTLGLLTVAMYTVINILSSEFSMEEDSRRAASYYGENSDNNSPQEEAYEYFVLKVQRKPKTTNLGDRVHKLRSKKLLKSALDTANKANNLWINKGDEHANINKLNNRDSDKTWRKTGTRNGDLREKDNFDKYDNEASYEDNNTEEYEDDDYENEEEYEIEGGDNDDNDEDEGGDNKVKDYEFPTNAPFKPGDFGDIRGLEYYAKPKLQFEQVKVEEKKLQLAQTTKRPTPDLTGNKIYWSKYVETLIPKGKFLYYLSRTPLISNITHASVID